jgi:hypothetical protein
MNRRSNEIAHRPRIPRAGVPSAHLTAVRWPGKEVKSPLPPPLRTVRDSFPSYGSSFGQRIVYYHAGKGVANTRVSLAANPARYCMSATAVSALRMPAGPGEAAPARSLQPADISALPPEVVCSWFTGAVTRGKSARFPVGCCRRPAQPLSVPLQDGLRLLPPPLPAAPSAGLAVRFPPLGEDFGLTMFRINT